MINAIKNWFEGGTAKPSEFEAAIDAFKQSEHWPAVRTCPSETGFEEFVRWLRNGD